MDDFEERQRERERRRREREEERKREEEEVRNQLVVLTGHSLSVKGLKEMLRLKKGEREGRKRDWQPKLQQPGSLPILL